MTKKAVIAALATHSLKTMQYLLRILLAHGVHVSEIFVVVRGRSLVRVSLTGPPCWPTPPGFFKNARLVWPGGQLQAYYYYPATCKYARETAVNTTFVSGTHLGVHAHLGFDRFICLRCVSNSATVSPLIVHTLKTGLLIASS